LETKRLFIAFALSAAILLGWALIQEKYFPAPKHQPPAPTASATTTSASATASVATTTTAAAPGTAAPSPGAAVPAPAAVRGEPLVAAAEEEIRVEKPLYTVRLSNRGGDVTGVVLSKFTDGLGKPLDLVSHGATSPGRTLRLDPLDPFLSRAAAALWVSSREEKGDRTVVRFRYREADGSGLVRTYSFGADHVAKLRVEREGPPGPVAVVLTAGIGNPTPDEMTRYTKPGGTIVLSLSGSAARKPKDGLKDSVAAGKVAVAGIEDNYFLVAFLPEGAASATLRPIALEMPPTAEGKKASETASEVVLSAPGPLDTDLYFGPKELDLLERTRPGMGRIIDYGWFAIIVQPLLWTLKAIHRVVHNWGVAILIITILIKLVLYPLTHKQLVSMKKMSRLQPKMETIRTKWAGKIKQDPQARVKMNEEMMSLYKQEGVNPAGGCLPLLLQMPILIAFYNLLAHSIELRHAPFMLWITDLSAKDPYYVTPILMTITMWIQQQMTPPTGDPAMRRVMNIMPFAMGFFFKDVASGLVLYWLMQNVLTIVQQTILNKYTDLGPASMKAAQKG
jgi:YidC/Oxa1 family membrane protein insertase